MKKQIQALALEDKFRENNQPLEDIEISLLKLKVIRRSKSSAMYMILKNKYLNT